MDPSTRLGLLRRRNPPAAIWILGWLLSILLHGSCLDATEPTVTVSPPYRSLLGELLVSPDLPDEFRLEQETLLAEARGRVSRNPDDLEARIWVGRRLAYLTRYREAIEVYSEAILLHPREARLYRHRGHRYITVRRLDLAVNDLEQAARWIAGQPDRIEPDGLPNAFNLPRSTLNSNVWYHLGLAYYLQGDWANAARCYRQGLGFASNPDTLCAMTHWLYMTLRRMGREAEAVAVLEPIHDEMEIIENGSYHELLLMYRGERSAEDLLEQAYRGSAVDQATVGYGVGNWYFYNGDAEKATEILEHVIGSPQHAAFGFIAAEADLARDHGVKS